MTGREYLTTLSDRELAKVIKHGGENIEDLCKRDPEKCSQYHDCYNCIENWLKSERGGLQPKYSVNDTVWSIGRVRRDYGGYIATPCKITKVNINKYSISYKILKLRHAYYSYLFGVGLTSKECDTFSTKEECEEQIIERGWKLIRELTEADEKVAKKKLIEAAKNEMCFSWVKECAEQIKRGQEVRKNILMDVFYGTKMIRTK